MAHDAVRSSPEGDEPPVEDGFVRKEVSELRVNVGKLSVVALAVSRPAGRRAIDGEAVEEAKAVPRRFENPLSARGLRVVVESSMGATSAIGSSQAREAALGSDTGSRASGRLWAHAGREATEREDDARGEKAGRQRKEPVQGAMGEKADEAEALVLREGDARDEEEQPQAARARNDRFLIGMSRG